MAILPERVDDAVRTEGAGDEAHGIVVMKECWICYDSTTPEPLIQPCACRGSMSGVHASCVERWIRHYRRLHMAAEAPRCIVCKQPYHGREHVPGTRVYAVYLARGAIEAVQRTIVPLVLCYGFHGVVQGCSYRLPPLLRTSLAVTLPFVATHKLLILASSLPPNQTEPRDPRLRYFYISNQQKLRRVMTDGFVLSLMIASLSLLGDLSLLVPFALLVAVLALASKCYLRTVLDQYHSMRGGLENAHCFQYTIAVTIAAPLLVLRAGQQCARAARQCARRCLHPLGAGPHMAIATFTIALCIPSASGVLILALWAAHAGLVTSCLLEVFTIRRLRWRRGRRWGFAVWDAIVVAVYVNKFRNCVKSTVSSQQEAVSGALFIWSFLWVGLLACFAAKLNWASCIRHHRYWQRRHMVFRIQVAADDGYVALPDGP